MGLLRLITYLGLPLPKVRRVLLIVFLWTSLCYLFFHFIHIQSVPFYHGQNLGRELLQQDSSDYIHDTTSRPETKATSLVDAKINVDESPSLNEKQLLKLWSKHSNLPLAYWAETKNRKMNESSCAKFPSLFDINFNNIYWQRLSFSNAVFYLYGAYYDNRKGVGKLPLVRIIAMTNKIKPPPVFCQFWYDNETSSKSLENSSFSKASFTYMWYKKWGNYRDGLLQPFVISCPVESYNNISVVPASVSLVKTKCQTPSNNLKVVYERPEKKADFAVCVKGLDFLYEDKSVRLVEWIELLNILGAKKIFFYELEVHPNISKVLSYYVDNGFVELTPLTLPGEQPNLPGFRHLYLKSKLITKRQNELIPYNDCLYKNLYSYEYIALLDTDEVIMPLDRDNWKDLMNDVLHSALKEKNHTLASYNFRNVYFLDDLQDGKELSHLAHEEGIPNYLHMLQHVYRSKNYTKPGSFVKCFHNTEQVVSLHNHFPMNCFGPCTTYAVNTSIAHLQHYRKDCVDNLKKTCTDFRNYTTRDTSVWRFKDELIKRTTKTLRHLGFFEGYKPSSNFT